MMHCIIEKTYIIYCHINKINGKVYVGQTKHSDNPNKRWKDGEGYAYNTHFWRAIQKYGWNNFEHIILVKDLSKEEADELEKYYIRKYNSTDNKYGYNKAIGGQHIVSEETKQKLSESHIGKIPWNKGKHIPEETKQKISNTLTGTRLSEETKRKISESNLGKHSIPKSEETRQKLSDSLKGRKVIFSDEHKQKLSESGKGKNKDRVWITDGNICKFVKTEELRQYLSDGWKRGRIITKNKQ